MARTLDDLASLDFEALGKLYRKAKVPGPVEGDYLGRMLASNPEAHLPGLWRALEGFAASPLFPWRGKSFLPGGEGINRLTPLELRLFQFQTRPEKSLFGNFQTLTIDYDHPGNPWLIRKIHDEVREVAPGLLLGQMWLRLGEPRLTVYFGLQNPAE